MMMFAFWGCIPQIKKAEQIIIYAANIGTKKLACINIDKIIKLDIIIISKVMYVLSQKLILG